MVRKYIKKISDLPEKYQEGFLVRMDAREVITRQLQRAYCNIVEDTGGPDGQTHLRLALIERAVFLEFQLQKWEREMLRGIASDKAIGAWIQATNALLGLARTLGLSRTRIENAIDALYSDPDADESPTSSPTAATVAKVGEGRNTSPKPKRPRQRLKLREEI